MFFIDPIKEVDIVPVPIVHSLNKPSRDSIVYDIKSDCNLKHDSTTETAKNESKNSLPSASKYTRDSGYRSDLDNITQISLPQTTVNKPNDSAVKEVSPLSVNTRLQDLKSRSRLPISIRSSFNLTLMKNNQLKEIQNKPLNDENSSPIGFNNFTYNSPSNNCTKKASRFLSPKPSKKSDKVHLRRSLDSSITATDRIYTVPIDLEENKTQVNFKRSDYLKDKADARSSLAFKDLDVKKIELDSINQTPETNGNQFLLKKVKNQRKIWTVILKHEANSIQEINVTPGMLVLVIRETDNWLYVKLTGSETSHNAQQYGYVPRSCAVDLHQIIQRNQEELSNCERSNNRRSQITAL